MTFSTGQVLHKRYRIGKLLGQGGMGAVHWAWDMRLDIPVAIKENLDTSPEAKRQFEREARILARVAHPNLPRVTDHFFIPNQGQYLVMDYVEGESLGAMLQRLGNLPEPQVLIWIEQVCDALVYLHSRPSPVIHRDIKPDNIKIRPDGIAMLVDFGIAKVYDPHLATTVGAKAVTPGYSPPEQYGSGRTDARSDIYALGATLYNLLTGEVPPESVQRVVNQATLSRPRQINQQITPLVEQVILKAVEVTTERRFQDVSELRAALTQPLQHSDPVSEIQANTMVIQRNTLLSTGIGWKAVLAVLGIIVTLLLYQGLSHIISPTSDEDLVVTVDASDSFITTTLVAEFTLPPSTYTPYPTTTPYPTYTPYVEVTPPTFGSINIALCSVAQFDNGVCANMVTVFPRDTTAVYATWQSEEALATQQMFTRRWYQEDVLILESSHTAGENARWTPDDGRSYYVYISALEGSGQRIFNATSFPSGQYAFELLIDGKSASIIDFTVE